MATHMPLTREQMLAEMEQALDEEIAKKSAEKSIKHSATDGKLLSEGNGQYIYQFTLVDPWTPDDDAPLTIANDAAKGIRCSVVNSTGTLLTIAADKALPPEVLRQIDLSDDSTELLRRQKQALKEADEGKAQLASKSFGLVLSQQLMAQSVRQFGSMPLRDAQYQAAQMALGGEVTFIVGPPGTGKTMTLAAIAFQLLQERRTVLIAAHTNIAIDNAIMKLCEMCKEADRSDLLANSQVVRYGAVQKAELKNDERYAEVYLPKIAKRLGVEAVECQAKAEAELGQVKAQLVAILQQQQASIEEWERKREELFKEQERKRKDIIEQITGCTQELTRHELEEKRRIENLRTRQSQHIAYDERLEREVKRAEQEYARIKAQEMEQQHKLENWQQQEQQAVARLVEARAMSNVKRFFKGLKIESLEAHVAQYGQKVYEIQQALRALQPEIERIRHELVGWNEERARRKRQLRSIEEELNTPSQLALQIAELNAKKAQLQRQLAQIPMTVPQRETPFVAQIQSLRDQQTKLEIELESLEQQLRDVEKSIVEKALVVGTTLTKTYMNQTVAGRSYETVILDEVSMAPMPLVYLAAAHAEHSVTLIGDPQQLAPIVTANKPMAEKWLGTDLFNFRDVSLLAAKQNKQHSVLLDVQSRMHPDIARIANQLVYGGDLQDEFDLSKLKQVFPLPMSTLVLCDTEDAYPIATRPANNKSWKNYYHALCCVSLARKLLDDQPELKKPEPTIGIVTPYRPQAQLLQSLIKDADMQMHVQAGTVHRFQGLEFDVIIFDTVESTGSFASKFIAGGYGSNAMRLLNVAVTRAKQKLIIVANQRFICQRFGVDSVVRQAVLLAASKAVVPSLDIVGTPFSSLVSKVQSKGPVINKPSLMLAQIDLAQEEFLVLTPAPEEQHFTEETFYEAFKRDMQRARASILIASPFLAEARVNNVLPFLLDQQKRGISISVYTRPLEEGSERDVKGANILLQAGIALIYLSQMHHKAVIIDESILYHGSLNALSYRDTGESMLRITTPRIIQEVRESLSESQTTKQTRIITLTEAEEKMLKKVSVSIKQLPPATKNCECGSKLVPRLGRDDSAFYGCSNYYNGCVHKSKENLTLQHLQQVTVLQQQLCIKCGKSLIPQIRTWPPLILLVCSADCGGRQKVVFSR